MKATNAVHLWVSMMEKLKDVPPALFALAQLTGTIVCIYAIFDLGQIARFLVQSIE